MQDENPYDKVPALALSPVFKNTDDAPAEDVLRAVMQCALSWQPDVRLLGNVRAGDMARAIAEILTQVDNALDACQHDCFRKY